MTESLYPVISGLVRRQKSNGRAVYDKQAKRALIEAACQPGVSVARLAMEHAVNANLLRKWVRQYQLDRSEKGSVGAQPTGSLLPVVTVDAPRSGNNASESRIEIEIGAALVRVQGAVDAQQLRVVLSCLRDSA